MKKKTILDFRRMAAEGEKIVYLTGYDYLTAKYEERAGIDMILWAMTAPTLSPWRTCSSTARRYAGAPPTPLS